MTIENYRIKDFINNELREFSNYDNVRSIPSIIDGLKDSQRKAVFGMFEHGTSEIRVSQLGGHAALVTAYQHGEVSMNDTIVGLAQRFPGANNINLFEPIGQFGSILNPKSASHRYIYTKPSAFLRKYIRKEDDVILTHRVEEDENLEPVNYFPVLPMWIVNGARGIGTGHSVRILPRDPKKVAALVEKLVTGVNVQQKTVESALTPFFDGWKGTVVAGGSDTQWELHGVLEVVNTTTIKVTELPVTYDVNKFKSILIDLMDSGSVKDFDNDSDDRGFNFVISVPREVGKRDHAELMKLFKLIERVGENVTLWDANGLLKKYSGVHEALLEFVEFRRGKYQVRKDAQLAVMGDEMDWLKNKIKFITYWNTKLKDPHKKDRDELKGELSGVIDEQYFDRLLSMQISSLTLEKIEELKTEVRGLHARHETLSNTTIDALFVADVKNL